MRSRCHWSKVEERELYQIGYGPTAAPHVTWTRSEPQLSLTQPEIASLRDTHGNADLWVMQVGTFDRSPALLLASL